MFDCVSSQSHIKTPLARRKILDRLTGTVPVETDIHRMHTCKTAHPALPDSITELSSCVLEFRDADKSSRKALDSVTNNRRWLDEQQRCSTMRNWKFATLKDLFFNLFLQSEKNVQGRKILL